MVELTTSFSEPADETELPEYRPLSPLAIISLLLGSLSAGVLVSNALWGFAVVGAVVSLVAIARLSREQGRIAGRTAAMVGLGLSLFFTAYSPAKEQGRKWLLTRDSLPVANEWFEALADGKVELAHQLTREPSNRNSMDYELLKGYYANNLDETHKLDEYASTEPVKSLLALGRNRQVQFIRTARVEKERFHDRLIAKFKVTPKNSKGSAQTANATGTFFVNIAMKRTLYPGNKRGKWHIENVGMTNN